MMTYIVFYCCLLVPLCHMATFTDNGRFRLGSRQTCVINYAPFMSERPSTGE